MCTTGENALLLLKVLVVNSTAAGNAPSHHVIQTIILPMDQDSSSLVTKMEFLGSGPNAHIYIGTETDIYRVPVQTCSSYDSCCLCVTSRDPYCAFDTSSGSCTTFDATGQQGALIRDYISGDSGLCASTTGGGVTDVGVESTGTRMCSSSSPPPPPGPPPPSTSVNGGTGPGSSGKDSSI